MELFRHVFARGLRGALSHWRVVLPLYLVGLLIGLVQSWPVLAAGGAALYNPALDQLATGGTDALGDLLLSAPRAVGSAATIWAIAALLLTLLYSLAYNLLSGGIVSVYAGAAPFWEGCRRWFWSFTGLGVLLLILAAFAATLGWLLGALAGQRGAGIGALALLQLVGATGEYARAQAVARGRRNPAVLIGLALGFMRRHWAGVLALALVGVLLHAALAWLYTLVAGALTGSPAGVLWQQAVALSWLWVKLLRLAWAVSYVRAAGASGAPSVDAPGLPAAA